jgi:DNA-binding NtrC family response regulator
VAVLVVEDDAIVRMNAADLLTEAGYDVIQSASGEAALAAIDLDPGRVTHVFADHRLAGSMSGLDLARLINARYLHIRVVMTSGYPVEGDDVDLVCARFIQKPWTNIDVLNVVV